MRLRQIAASLLGGILLSAFAIPAHAATELRPDLRMLAPSDFRIENTGSEKRLRFTTVIVNRGTGPFHVLARRASTSEPKMRLRQSITLSDGRVRRIDIPAPQHAFWSGDGHNHWHLWKMQQFQIAAVAADGTVGRIRGYGVKTGFCFWDNTRAGATSAPRYTGCGVRTATQVTMGLSPGWGDTYRAGLAYQWIRINGLPDGKYRIRVNADPGRVFTESNEGNNVAFRYIQIRGNTVTVV